MNAIFRNLFGITVLSTALVLSLQAQQDTSGVQQNAGQASQPEASSTSPDGRVGSDIPSASKSSPSPQPATSDVGPAPSGTSTTNNADLGDNPYDPILEPPPLPKGKATLIGGIATSVDHVRNHITIQPFGGGKKIKVMVDERSHIYRNGTPTTILGVHKGDRIYVDTLLDTSNKILAKNVRVVTDTGLAEVRGQVIAARDDKGVITVRDQLSSKPVTFSVGAGTSYNSTKGPANVGDVQPGALIDVQFSPRHGDRDVARQITVIAKPGDNYIFSGTITTLDMRTNSMFVENKSDEQTYELHFTPTEVADLRDLRVGSQVTARAVFDGKQYKASNIRIQAPGEEPTAQ